MCFLVMKVKEWKNGILFLMLSLIFLLIHGIFNFIVTDTIENRVREVLEEKLSVILKEMGVDKYSDVLDSEVAEVDFTGVYMRSISRPHRKSDENLYPVESELRQELKNAQKYKSLLHEDKDLTKLVGKESNFDVDSALRQMLTYYDAWQIGRAHV